MSEASPWRSAHLVGIGGSGMASLAELLLDRGVVVSGSDGQAGERTRALAARGVAIAVGPGQAAHLPAHVEVLIHSRAVANDHVERAAARERGIPELAYPLALQKLMREGIGVAIAGTHGKTSTTAMVAHVLSSGGRSPSFVIGGVMTAHARGGAGGSGPHIVVEACEYQDSFLSLPRHVAAITNIELDHPDCFADAAALRRSFLAFAMGVAPQGALVVSPTVLDWFGADRGALPSRVLCAGDAAAAQLRPAELHFERGCARFHLAGLASAGPVRLAVPGRHALANALIAAGVLIALGEAPEAIVHGLSDFAGVGRRFEVIADGRIALVADYAHHPTELQALAQAARAHFADRRLVLLFQPHQAARTRAYLAEFATALARFDRVWLAPIYAARDSVADLRAVSSADVAQRVIDAGGHARALASRDAAVPEVIADVRSGDVVLLVGAGDIDGLRDDLAAALSGAH